MLLKGFTYAMIGALACGLVMTFIGSANQVLGL
jgi:hypothetical protein